jgi:hypothetical protein
MTDSLKTDTLLTLRIESTVPFDRKGIEVSVGETLLTPTFAKGSDVRLVDLPPSPEFPYIKEITLNPSIPIGETVVTANVEGIQKEVSKTVKLAIKRENAPNLFLFCVGIRGYQHKDSLLYSDNDVRNFITRFRNQEGKIFKKITQVDITNTENSAELIKVRLREMAKLVGKNDVMIVLLSGHGSTPNKDGKELWFWGSDFYEGDTNSYVDYERDIRTPLKNAKGYSILLLDACRNEVKPPTRGQEDYVNPNTVQLSRTSANIINGTRTFRALLSTGNGYFSYEAPQYQQGAFTQAVLEAFDNKKVLCEDGKYYCANTILGTSENTDNVLTFRELAKFVRLRVPVIARDIPKDPVKKKLYTQVPVIRDDEVSYEDLEFFWIQKR